MNPSRRHVLQSSAILGAAAFMARATFAQAAPETLVVGVMGVNGRGTSLAGTFAQRPGVQIKYVCDVDSTAAARCAKVIEKAAGKAPLAVGDFHKILEDKEVHILVIATPNHWHAPATILGCAAGKHVYVEKPCSHNAREGELAVAAARKFNRMVQHGTQRRSYSKIIEACTRVRNGDLGRVAFCRSWYTNSRKTIGKGKQVPVPSNLDYALWQGPAPERPYKDNLIHYNWHWHWHWGNGELGNNGVHGLDLCRWGMGVDYPAKVTSAGARYHFDDDQETPDTHVVTFDYGDRMITWEGRSCVPHGLENSGFGVMFYGEKGTLILEGGNGYRIVDAKGKELEKVSDKASDNDHIANFLDAIRGKAKLNADIEEAHKSALMCHLGNIAHRVGRVLTCDPKTGMITNDKDAAAQWAREYRPGWEPKV